MKLPFKKHMDHQGIVTKLDQERKLHKELQEEFPDPKCPSCNANDSFVFRPVSRDPNISRNTVVQVVITYCQSCGFVLGTAAGAN